MNGRGPERGLRGQRLHGLAGLAVLAMAAAVASASCRDGGRGGPIEDGGPDGDAGDSGPDGDSDPCGLAGTYGVVSVEVQSGSCDYEPGDESLAVRSAGPWTLVDFEGIGWRDGVTAEASCSLSVHGPDNSYWNGARRTSSLELRVEGDRAEASLSDRLEGQDSEGRSCDVVWRIELERSGPPPAGAGVGEDGCGGVGCSASRCVFGQVFGCESGVCLLDATGSWLETICSAPCARDEECPDGFECEPTYEQWDGAPAGSYCARWRAVCGNGELEEGETCDDGNRVGGDGCSEDCTSDESCGNGIFEADEECETSAYGEWLPCTDACRFDPPAGVETPVPFWSGNVRSAGTGPGRFVVVATGSMFFDIDGPRLAFARTADGGESWTSGTIAVDDWAWPVVADVVALGSRVVTGMVDGSGGLYLAESDDGGSSWSSAARQTLPAGTSTAGPYGESSLRILASSGGGVVAAVRSDDGVAVIRRASGAGAWTVAGALDVTPPAGATSCDWHWNPHRFDRRYNGAGVRLYRSGEEVRLVAGGTCIVESRWVHVLRTMASDDGGSSFGATEDLVEAAGLAEAEIALTTDGPDGPAAVCLGGLQAGGGQLMACGVAPAAGSAWELLPTGLTWPDAWATPPDALCRTPTGRLVLAQRMGTERVTRLHASDPSLASWTAVDVPDADAFYRGLFDLSGEVVWLVEVDGNNETSLVRADLATGTAGERLYLFGDARRGDGSGVPWEASWSSDGVGRGLLGFSLPDALRSTVTVLRRMN